MVFGCLVCCLLGSAGSFVILVFEFGLFWWFGVLLFVHFRVLFVCCFGISGCLDSCLFWFYYLVVFDLFCFGLFMLVFGACVLTES